jgi:hypothetical protein
MSANQITYKLLRRKPPKWHVTDGERTAYVIKNPDNQGRAKRWLVVPDNYEGKQKFCPSRRAAFHFFRTGEKFTTTPVYAVVGGRRSQKRVR